MAAEGVGSGGGSREVAEILLAHGADPSAMSEVGWQGSGGSGDESPDRIIAYFLSDESQGTFLNQVVTDMPNIRRSNSNNIFGSNAFMQTQSMEGCSFTFPTMSYGGTPLNRAAFRGNADAARLLLDAGADVESMDGAGTAALWRAAAGGHDTVVQLLLERGADVNVRDQGDTDIYGPWVLYYGEALSTHGTALSRATYYSYSSTIRLLLEAGADIEL